MIGTKHEIFVIIVPYVPIGCLRVQVPDYTWDYMINVES